MNAPDKFFLPDIQSIADDRQIAIDRVGVKGLSYPMRVATRDGREQPTVAAVDMTVRLPEDVKGTHMSRFVEILEAFDEPLDGASFRAMAGRMLDRLGADAGVVEMRFPYFVRKRAPVSGVESLLDYQVALTGEMARDGFAESFRLTVCVQVPVTSLCPCSKEISRYGAHNQRSHITIAAELAAQMAIEELVAIAEQEASCELYGLLKRPDEKFVTERAYENPKFAEDLVRDIARRLDADPRIAAFELESENFESIHNHSAYARISRRKAA